MAVKKKTAKKKAKKAKAAPPAKKIARQRALPGMGDRKVASIENAALDYAEIRDQRQELTKQESELKQKLMGLLKKLGKTEYKRNGIRVWISIKEETVKVRVRDEDEEDSKTEVELKQDAPDSTPEEDEEEEHPDTETESEEEEEPEHSEP